MLEPASLAAHRKRLHRFVGLWAGEETLAPSPWAAAGTAWGHVTFALDLGGVILTQQYRQERGGQPSFALHGVLTVDPQQGDVLYYAFDSFGFPPLEPARGCWAGDTLVVTKRTPRGEARHHFAWQADHYDYTVENRFPGQDGFTPFLTATYVRLP
ncbi:DUF1579 domain-containing protein [Deinococcus aluminii]|uniref:DUF1579 domain-containing protein n=1 Tax=Deinococcus aluminii TaxID=1656885 RepID=A0ABP9XA68_9DEIO